MNFLPEKKYGVPSHNFVEKIVLCEKGDEITRFDGTYLSSLRRVLEEGERRRARGACALSISISRHLESRVYAMYKRRTSNPPPPPPPAPLPPPSPATSGTFASVDGR
jgi:hypothetical protein